MTKKQYILSNEAIATHDYYRMQIHGIEYGINDYAYVARLYQPTYCGSTKVAFHKVKIYTDFEGTQYIVINEKFYNGKRHKLRLNLDSFIRIDSGYGIHTVPCSELACL